MKNPWLGLSSYTEESLKEYQFNGRSAAIASLTSMVRQNLFVTLYGRSGIGKTSVLQAGVFPVLRREGFIPIAVRLDNIKDGNDSAANEIWVITLETLRRDGYIYTPCNEEDVYTPDFSDILVFRKLFSAGRFFNKNGEEAIPVIVLDQFEEILYKAPASSWHLVSQLYALIDDNYDLSVSHPHWHDDTYFRVVVSIREDDLFLFEDAIDSLNCADFKSNRYRLMPLSDSEAKDVILKPVSGKHIFEEEVEDKIAEKIIDLSRSNGQNINTLLLSLICYVLFNDGTRHNKRVTVSDLGNYQNIIETYYKEVTKNVPKAQRYYIEDHLIDNQGRRISIYISDLEKYAPEAKQLLENSNHRLLNENQGRVEFIHDQLAASVMKIRETRKSKNTRLLGILALVILLTCLFLFSFSFYPFHPYGNGVSQYSLVNNIEVSSAVVETDSLNPYFYIYDCPSLKTIDIVSPNSKVEVYNCPSLVNISYPENFYGWIRVFNCPYVNVHDDKIDTMRLLHGKDSPYMSQFPYSSGVARIDSVGFSYDSIKNTLTVKLYPVFMRKNKYYKRLTGLPDSIKRITDCYVPYGCRDELSRLVEYQPFHSIKELPIYYTWRFHIIGILWFFKHEILWLILSMIAIIVVQFFFWIVAYNKYKTLYNSALVVLALSFIYGVGMSLLALLSFMAFYWTVFNIIWPWHQLASTIIGAICSLICMCIVYKNVFYSLIKYTKNHGIREFIKDMHDGLAQLSKQMKSWCKKQIKHIQRNAKTIIALLISVIIIVAVAVASSYLYNNGKEKREYYLVQLSGVLDNGEYARAYAIIQELNNQHKSVLYPFFTESLDSMKMKIDGDSISLAYRITPSLINDIASRQNTPLNCTDITRLAVADDASKLVIRVQYRNNDLNYIYRAILLDLRKQSVEVLTPESEHYTTLTSCFSPSGNSLIVRDSYAKKVYSFSNVDRTIMDITNDKNRGLDDMIMVNDSTYYFANYYLLYKGLVKSDSQPVVVNKSEKIWNELTLISNNLIGGIGYWHDIIIFNTAADSAYFHSKKRYTGNLRSINKDYAITTRGLFDIKMDSLIKENDNLYEYKGNIVELKKHDGLYSFFDLNGNEQLKVGDRLDLNKDIVFSKDGNSLVDGRYGIISVYSFTPLADREWKISDIDKQMFDLK